MRLGGIAVAAAVLLGACTSDPAPQEPDPAPTTASSTPSRPVPTMPAQASEDSPEGAAAFVTHYVDVFNYAAATGDIAELSRLSSPDCTGCQKYIALYRDTYAAGGYFKGGDWKIGGIEIRVVKPVTYVTTTAVTEPGPYRESANSPEYVSSGTDNTVSFAMQPEAGSWLVAQFGLGGIQ